MNVNGPSSAPSARIDALDGLRAIAILCVVLRHAVPNSFRLAPWVAAAMGAGWIGVDIFFVLSGFLISGILLDARGEGPRAPRGYYRAFYARRALRIFPVYYAFLIFVFVVRRAQVPGGAWWYWAYLTNVLFARTGMSGGQPHLWSLAVEEQFYLFWPAAISLIPRSWLRPVCWGIIVASTGLRVVIAVRWGWTPAYTLTVCRLDEFAAGALLALSVRSRPLPARWVRAAAVGSTLPLLALAAAGALVDPETPFRLEVGCVLATIMTVACIWLVIPANGAGRLSRLLRNPVLLSIGRYSYTIYIVHYQVGEWIKVHVVSRYAVTHPSVRTVLEIVGTVALSWAIAWVSWRVLERPLLSLKRFLPMPRPVEIPLGEGPRTVELLASS